ncbi:MAG: WYL domain-containing protein [Phormidium sp.]
MELEGKINLIKVKVRFFPTVIDFILEGEKRHPTQRLRKGPIDSLTGKFAYVDYIVELPPRSLGEFSWWVCRQMENAEVLEPDFLRQQHYQAALALVARYQ